MQKPTPHYSLPTVRINLILISLALMIVGSLLLLFYVQDIVDLIWTDKCPESLKSLIDTVYPRFQVEKNRLPIHFFYNKATQVVYRLLLVEIGALLWTLSQITKHKSRSLLIETNHNTSFLRAVYYLFLLVTTYDWFFALDRLHMVKPFYKPVLLLQPFGHTLPNILFLQGFYLLMVLMCIMVLVGKWQTWAPTAVILSFIYFEATFNSFEKINHTYTTFIYAGLLLPLYLYNPSKRKWALQLIQVVVASCYFLAGLEKVLISGGQWLKYETMHTYLTLHQAPMGLWVAQYPVLCTGLSAGAVLLQLCFLSGLFYKKLRLPVLLAGLVFHWGTVLLFDMSSLLNPWLVVYVFFIDTENIVQAIKKRREPQAQALDSQNQ